MSCGTVKTSAGIHYLTGAAGGGHAPRPCAKSGIKRISAMLSPNVPAVSTENGISTLPSFAPAAFEHDIGMTRRRQAPTGLALKVRVTSNIAPPELSQSGPVHRMPSRTRPLGRRSMR